jgi:hypothetical protein
MTQEKKPAENHDKVEDRKQDPLVDRLQHLNWLEPPTEVKQRSWERFKEMMTEGHQEVPEDDAS